MEGDREITLEEPSLADEPDEFGQVVSDMVVEHVVFATRRDRGGREDVQASAVVGSWGSIFQVRQLGLEDIGQHWSLIDDNGREYDIERISEVAFPPKRWFQLYCVAR